MAQVYRARDRLLDRPVALKVLFPELSVDRAFVERFRREAQAAANLSHPNIVPVFDWGEDGGTYFIVMEFVDGQPLSAVLRDHGPAGRRPGGRHRRRTWPPPWPTPTATASSTATSSRATSSSPTTGQVKVTDFGIARAVNTEESLTQTGAVMGTATYFSPEQAEGIGVDARSDIYSLGVVLFEMVAGRPPFLGDTPVAVASKHVRDQPPPLRELSADGPGRPRGRHREGHGEVARRPLRRPPTTCGPTSSGSSTAGRSRPCDPGPTRMQTAIGAAALGPASPRSVGAVTTGAQAVPGPTRAPAKDEDEARRRRTRRLVTALVILLVALAVVAVLLLRSLGYLGGKSTVHHAQRGRTDRRGGHGRLRHDGFVDRFDQPGHQPAKAGTCSDQAQAGASVKKGDTCPSRSAQRPGQAGPGALRGRPDPAVAEATLQSAQLGYRFRFVVSSSPERHRDRPGHRRRHVGQAGHPGAPHRAGATTRRCPTSSATPRPRPAASSAGPTCRSGSTTQHCSNTIGNGLVSASNPGRGRGAQGHLGLAHRVHRPVLGRGAQRGRPDPELGPVHPVGPGLHQRDRQQHRPAATRRPTATSSASRPTAGTTAPTSAPVTITVCQATTTTTAPTTTTTAPTTTTTAPTTTTTVPPTTSPT